MTLAPRRGLIALAVWSAGLTWIFALDDPRLRFSAFLAGMFAAGIAWAVLVLRGLDARWVRPAAALAALARVAFVLTPPALSDDVFRYVYEGRVVWEMGPAFVFTHAPANALADGVPPALLDEAWLRINHPELATIYPPFSQLVFVLAAGRLWLLKALLVAAEFVAYAVIGKKFGREPAVVLALCPLAAFELAHEGHADGLAMLGLALGSTLVFSGAFAGFSLAALAKLNGLIALLPLLRATRKGWWIAALALALLALPYLVAGAADNAALFAYAGAWRSGDGVFSILLALAEAILGGDWTRIAGFTITRHQLARAFTAAIFFSYAVVLLRKRPSMEEVPERAAALILALLLLSPALHPWYTLWLLPFLPFAPRLAPAIIAFIVLAPLLHHGTWLELVDGKWRELGVLRAVVHVPVWLLFGYARFACPSKKAS